MKIKDLKTNKKAIFLCIAFVFLFLSYSVNLWRISPADLFHGFEKAPEGLVVGRLIKADHDGVLSGGGFTGITYNTDSLGNEEDAVNKYRVRQHDIYLTDKPLPEKFFSYKSQSGGQAIVYSCIQQISPLTNSANMQLFRVINSLLTALCFVLFLAWCYRNFGFISSLVTFILLLLSPWLNVFAHNLWWSLWSFYLPFLTVLLLLDKKHRQHNVSDTVIYILLFVAVFIKCFFSGFEFITSTLLAIICPVVFYSYLERKSFASFLVRSVKVGLCAVAAVVAEMFVLTLQIRALEGSFAAGWQHIIASYTKRTNNPVADDNVASLGYPEVLQKYFSGNAFETSFFPHLIVGFGILVLVILVFGIVTSFFASRLPERKKKYSVSLIVTTVFSILCPLSWFIIFKQHATVHPHLDYIVWYMPFLLFGYLLIGHCISIVASETGLSVKQRDIIRRH